MSARYSQKIIPLIGRAALFSALSDRLQPMAKERTEPRKRPPRKGEGRPNSYDPARITAAQKLCALGATDVEIADFFEVSLTTFCKWKNDHPEFALALKAGKTEADERVVRSLYHKAVGYTFDSEKVFQFQGQIVRAQTREHVPPDTTAMIFWLKNRRPEDWRDVHKHEHGGVGDFDKMSDDELKRFVAEEGARISGGKTLN